MLGFVSDFLEKREGALTVFEDQGVSFHWFRKKGRYLFGLVMNLSRDLTQDLDEDSSFRQKCNDNLYQLLWCQNYGSPW